MTALLAGAVLVLLGLAVWQAAALRSRSKQLRYVHEKLNRILDEGSNERLLLFSGDARVRELLNDLNRLLDVNHKGGVERARLERSMRNMLANMSHDLKTPLTVVLGYSETLARGAALPDRERERIIQAIHAKAEETIGLMNAFFDLAKLESGDAAPELSRVELGEICRHNMLAFYDLLEAGGTEVRIELPEEPVYIMGNKEALNRILNNLISNAIRYGADGHMIGLKLYADRTSAHIEVWDRGKGIAEAHADKVFERLYTLEDSRNRAYQGSGLGLTITKRLTEQMDGSIALRSVPGVKTAFTVTFRRISFSAQPNK